MRWRMMVLVIVGFLGWWWRLESGRLTGLEVGQNIRLTGRVLQMPTAKEDRFTGELYDWVWVRVGSELFGFREDSAKGLVYGDRVEVVGKLKPLVFADHDKKQLVVAEVMVDRLQGFKPGKWVIDGPEVQILDKQQGWLYSWRQSMLATLVEGMPGDAGGLVAGMVLGSKGAISQELYNVMQRTGMLHVVVASGFNVMLVAGLLTQMWVRVVRRQVAVALAIVGIWLYVLVVGGEAPVVRAGLMGTFAYLAVIFGRLKQVHVLFIYALLVMVWWRPDWVWDVGWQLSVVATAGLLWVEPLLRRPTDVRFKIYDLRNLFDWPVVGASLRTSVAAQVMVWPIISYNFGELSLSSLVVNGLTLWMVPIITVGGMAMAMLGLGSIEVASGGLWLLKPLVELFLMANRWFVAVPMMSWQVGVVGVVSYYVCLCFLIGTWQR